MAGIGVNISLFIIVSLMVITFSQGLGLSSNYYHKTCPGAEAAITKAIQTAAKLDQTVPAALLRMHFHDCFVRACDGSVLLDSTKKHKAEKDGPPNVSLHAFYAIDNAKAAVEAICPGVVSCADVLALAARDAVVISGGPYWKVPKGRKDGRTSHASETRQLPAPVFNLTQLKQSFSQRGLSIKHLVALSGGHTLGFAHCSSFQNRIHSFDSIHDIDPSMHPTFAAGLRRLCPAHNKVRSAGSAMDSSPMLFDNTYFKMILQGKGLFSSDQALATGSGTRKWVERFAGEKEVFYGEFVKAMVKMSKIDGGGVEVRRSCRRVNSY